MSVTLNPDKEVVNTIREGLKRTGGYCPCRLQRTEERNSGIRLQIRILRDFVTACFTISR